MDALDAEGIEGQRAFRKAFSLDVEEPEPVTPTGSSVKLDAMAASIAKEKGITKQQAYAEAVVTPEGRELHTRHRVEAAAR